MKRLLGALSLALVCVSAALAETVTVVTENGIVVQGKLIKSDDTGVTVEVPLFGGRFMARDIIKNVYPEGELVEYKEEKTAVDGIIAENKLKEAEKAEKLRALTPRELPVERPPKEGATSSSTAPAKSAKKKSEEEEPLKATEKPKKTGEPAPKKPGEPLERAKKPAPGADGTKKPGEILETAPKAAPGPAPKVAPAAVPAIAPVPVPAPKPVPAPDKAPPPAVQ